MILAATLCAAALATVPSLAAVIPTAGGYYIQTNGPAAAINLGDFYASTSGGNQDHRLTIQIPCSWPSGKSVHVDLYGAEMTSFAAVQGKSEEPLGALDSSRFTLVDPGGTPTTTRTYQPTSVAEAWTRLATIADGRSQCGSWTLTDALLTADPLNPAGTGNDQNGWRLRVAGDDDTDPTNAPPADADNPDGVAGTDDEIAIGLERTTFQHDAGAITCQTFWSFVAPSQPSVKFHNFDMDGGSGRVRYYAPGTTVDPTATSGGIAGTVSGNARWNGSSGTTRVGDTITSPAAGWWAVVSCVSSHNQLIQEGGNSGLLFMKQPATPSLNISKDDGVTQIEAGGTTEYLVTVTNTSDSSTSPGAARSVVITDSLPPHLTYASCSIDAPAVGACSQASGTVTATLSGALNAGESATVRISVDVSDSAPTGTITNQARATYNDSYSNSFPAVTDTDVDDIVRPADLTISNTLESTAYAGQPNAMNVTVENLGVESADDVSVTGTIPSGFSVTSYDAPIGWSCSGVAATFTCSTTNDLAPGASVSLRVLGTITATPDDVVTFPVAVSTSTLETNLSNNNDSLVISAVAYPADVTVVTAIAESFETGQPNALVVTVGSEGLDDAADTTVGGEIPAGFTVSGFQAPANWTCTLSPSSWQCIRSGDLATGTTEEIRVLGTVDAAGGETVTFVTTVSTSTLELDFSDNEHTVNASAKALALTAAAVCIKDAPWLSLDTDALGFSPAPDQLATVVWKTLGGQIVQTDTDVPLEGGRLLWPGAAVDSNDRGIGWPGWTQVDGAWVEVPDDRDGTLFIEVSVNPSATTSVTYPEASALCAARPTVSSTGGGSGGSGTGGGGSTPSEPPTSPTPSSSPADDDAPSVGAAAGGLPRTGGDLLGSLVAAMLLMVLGMAAKIAARTRQPLA